MRLPAATRGFCMHAKGLLRKLHTVKENVRPFLKVSYHRVWGIKRCVNKNILRLYENFRGLVCLEAIRGRFRELEAVFESFLDFYD